MKIIEVRDIKIQVDDEDYENLIIYSWHIVNSASGNTSYAHRHCTKEERVNNYPKTITIHRQILGVILDSSIIIDHKNRNGLDNTRDNLRIATRTQNQMNRPGLRNMTSIYKGVYREKGLIKWRAQIQLNKKIRYIGQYNTEIEAAIAYNDKAIELFGEFAYLNIISNN